MAASDAIKNGESLALNELFTKAGIQNRKYRYILPFEASLTASGTAGDQSQVVIPISAQGDFYALKLSALLRVTSGAAQTSGVSIQITETGYGKQLFSNFVDLTLLASPGWGTNFYPLIDFEQLFLSKSDLQIELRNSTASTISVKGAFHGWQFLGSSRSAVPGY